MDRRIGITAAALAAAAAVGLCAGCSASSSSPGTSGSTTSAGGTSSGASGSGVPSLSGVPSFGSDAASTPFCQDLTGSALSDVTSGSSGVVNVWNRLAGDAPPAVRADVQQIDQYVDVAFKGGTQKNPADASSLSGAITHLTTWAAEHCGLGG